ncbi:MAG: RHS repeat-associated core domain-containing protein [Myxococcota bacterium]
MTSASGTPAQVWSLGRDGSGHVTHVDAVDTGGAPTASTLRRYSAFGVPREAATAHSIERGFASRPIEGASGLVYMRARHYDPTTGRFLQPDPIGCRAGVNLCADPDTV